MTTRPEALLLGARARLVAIVGAACALAACASIYGIDAPDIVEAGVGDASTDGTVVGEAGLDGGATDADGGVDSAVADSALMDSAIIVPDASTCGEAPDETVGVFVAPSGADSSACGSSIAPCLTIQNGITRAVSLSKANVYVATGTYSEAITLTGGITVWGGWTIEAGDGGDVWSGICSSPIGAVTLQPTTSNITVTANALGASPAGLKTLTILSKPQANVAAGESLYGVFATGTTTLVLENVDITMGNGGDGAPGYMADGGVEGNPVCNPGDGGPGAPGGSDGGGADAGSFTPSGYQPAAGDLGGTGNPGSNGSPDDAGTCVHCVSCAAPVNLGCESSDAGTSCGDPGGSGCGGGGGNGGGPGGGGGSSIAVFAWGGATVSIAGGALTAGNGGQGGAGGSGGPGGAGVAGLTGQNGTSCVVNCNISGFELSCPSSTSGEGQGSLGTKGGNGSGGGAGGGGSGGWSCGIVQGGGGTVVASPLATLGNYGFGVGGGANGKSQQVCP